MPEFRFIQNPVSKKWVIRALRRANRPDEAKTPQKICPFCPGQLQNEAQLYKEGEVVVVANKFPFAPVHEVIIHSSDHHKNFGELSLLQTELIFKTFRQRFQTYKDKGQVYIFHNRGEIAGESLIHPHSQLTVIPDEITLEIPPSESLDQNTTEVIQTTNYDIFCPESSEWPDEIWVAPRSSAMQNEVRIASTFGDATDEQISDLSNSLTKIIQALELRHGKEFPYNFYIYPGKDWYLRLMPRVRTLGGFEIGTKVFVNMQDPKETIGFLKENFR